MTTALQIWMVSSIVLSVISFLVGAIGLLATAGYRDTGEARFILACFAMIVAAPLWPLIAPAGLIYAASGLWGDADFETFSEWRERRRVAVEVERDRMVREQAATIARLEREAGIR